MKIARKEYRYDVVEVAHGDEFIRCYFEGCTIEIETTGLPFETFKASFNLCRFVDCIFEIKGIPRVSFLGNGQEDLIYIRDSIFRGKMRHIDIGKDVSVTHCDFTAADFSGGQEYYFQLFRGSNKQGLGLQETTYDTSSRKYDIKKFDSNAAYYGTCPLTGTPYTAAVMTMPGKGLATPSTSRRNAVVSHALTILRLYDADGNVVHEPVSVGGMLWDPNADGDSLSRTIVWKEREKVTLKRWVQNVFGRDRAPVARTGLTLVT